ncbi:Acyl-CoA dehydrogenase [Prauserella aidingensis]|uniref:acyl-CoA dehydrogenase family protein n=1 Tax=Prauserella aidingensis TaxID=387890 RepID=UPI0020A23A2C|nr:acyl-CoA dehydrogenase family protein [Prauserella aidingensis]MCP2256002.1 Acyl-CoA dehydrogenase [Prauserella aidingensis]
MTALRTAPTTGTDTDGVPTTAELVARARALHPLLKKNAAEGERERRVAQECIQALTEAGLFKLAVPKRYGGYETSVRTMLEVSAAVAEADGGAAWVVTLVNFCNRGVADYPVQAQDEVFGADPDAKVSGVFAPTSTARKVDGGWRVTGKWFYNSGSWHATWTVGGIPLTDEAGNVTGRGMALIPRSDLKLEDTWFVVGMRSSGSNCFIAEDVFVPDDRLINIMPVMAGAGADDLDVAPLYRTALAPLVSLALVGPQLGLGKAALEYVISKAATKGISGTSFTTQSESVGFQLQIAEAARLVDTAHLHAYRAADDLDEAAAAGEFPDLVTRARVRSSTGYAAECVTKAIDILLSAHGASSFAEVNPLQKIWRDSATAARHAAVPPQLNYELYGKSLLGVENTVTPIL